MGVSITRLRQSPLPLAAAKRPDEKKLALGALGGVRSVAALQRVDPLLDDPALAITAEHVMVLKGCGPRGYPGMPEVGNMPLPGRLLEQGVTDMVRISDARMSGTAYGTVVLHTSPESAAGGPLALVQTGDEIELDVPSRTLTLHVAADELARRKQAWTPPRALADRGWSKLYIDHVQQAEHGADLDFLVGGSGADVTREAH